MTETTNTTILPPPPESALKPELELTQDSGRIVSPAFVALCFAVLIGPLCYWIFLLLQYDARPTYLLSNVLYFALLLGAALLHTHMKRRRSYRMQMRQICRNPLAMFSLVLLCAYLSIASLDSLHLRPGPDTEPERLRGRTVSAFDLLTLALWEKVETTYSAPFARYSYSKESIENDEGILIRDFPRLRHGGAHIESDSELHREIRNGVARSAIHGLLAALMFLFVSGLISASAAKRQGLTFQQHLREILSGRGGASLISPAFAFALVVFVLSCIALFAPHYHIFGTDKVGQDVLYQALKSIRTGILIGTLTTLIMLPFAITLGILAGFFGGLVDDIIQYIYTTLSSIPGVLLIAASILLVQVYLATREESLDSLARGDLRLLFLCAILGITSWTSLCRILRAETLKVRELEFVRAARASGASTTRILTVHILPNLFHIILIIVILDFSSLVLAEAVLSYVGVGVDPSMNSWGNMINAARLELGREPIVWWSLAAAFSFMFVLVLAANILADAVRAAFDPRSREVL